MEIRQFINKNKIKIKSTLVSENPNFDEAKGWSGNHWRVRLSRPGKQFTLFFSTSNPAEPQTAEVLDCMASDSLGVDNTRGFEDWASEYGYDPDSRKAEKTYKTCIKQRDKFVHFLGQDLYSQLIDCEQI